MASQELNVETRNETGRHKVKHLRSAGKIPAVIYGKGQESVSLAIRADEFKLVVEQGERSITLSGAVSGAAYIKDVQWDVYGNHVLHVDFTHGSGGDNQVVVWRLPNDSTS